MRVFFTLLLLFMYAIASIGVNVTLHYCGGKYTSFSVGKSDTISCVCGNKIVKKNCCEDKTISFEIDDDQTNAEELSVSISKLYSYPKALSHVFSFLKNNKEIQEKENYFYPPPNRIKQSLYILNQVFLI
jgi:hypothetical protein